MLERDIEICLKVETHNTLKFQNSGKQLDAISKSEHTSASERTLSAVNSSESKITETETAFFRSLATTYFENADTLVECSICKTPVPLWEGLFVMYRFVGDIAHFNCPYDAFRAATIANGFNPHFDYENFCDQVEQAMQQAKLPETVILGEIECPTGVAALQP